MAFKQPRVPEYRERDGADGYIRSLVLFLKDFCMDVWTANNQRSGEISDAVKGYPVTSVCGKKGDVKLSASDVKARNETWLPSTDNLKSIQMASWNGNTEPSGLPAGITHVVVSGSGKDAGFPVGYATCVAVNLDPSRCIQLLIGKTNGKLWTRSSTDGSSWGSWQSYLPALQMYPVGSIYMSVNSTSPASLFGGTWEQLKDRFLLGAGSAYAAGSTGGEAAHTLSINEIPSHAGHLYGNAGGVNEKGDAKGAWLKEININSSLTTSYGWNYKNNEYYPANRSLGGGAAHNNMPPYLAVYMWKRVS